VLQQLSTQDNPLVNRIIDIMIEYTQKEKLLAFRNYRRHLYNNYATGIVLAAELYTVILGTFPQRGQRFTRPALLKVRESMCACAQLDEFLEEGKLRTMLKYFQNYIADVRSLLLHASDKLDVFIASAKSLEGFLSRNKLESRIEIRSFLSESNEGNTTPKKRKSSAIAVQLKKKKRKPASLGIREKEAIHVCHNKDKTVGAEFLKLPPGIEALPRNVIPDRTKSFGSIELLSKEEIMTAIVVQKPQQMTNPCKVPFFEETSAESSLCNNIYVIENSPCQLLIYHNLDKCLHYGTKSYDDTIEEAFQFSKKKRVGLNLLFRDKNYTNNEENWNKEITALNHGTAEYNISNFPSMNFDAEGIVRLLIFVLDDERNTELMKINEERKVAQFNFGYAASHCPDVHRCDPSDTVLLPPKILGMHAKLTKVEEEASKEIHENVGELCDCMQDSIHSNLSSNNGKPMNDPDRNNMFAAEINKKTGARISCGEAYSLNFQYLGELNENASNNEKTNMQRHKRITGGKLDPHLDRHNCSEPGYNIVCTFKCFLVVDGGKYCLTLIMYTRASCAEMLRKERSFAEPSYQIVKEYERTVLKGAVYSEMNLSKMFEGTQVHQAGKLTTVELLGTKNKKAIYPMSFQELCTCPQELSGIKKNVFCLYVIPSMITPRGWLSSLINSYRILWEKCQIERRQALAFLYIFCSCDSQIKVHFVLNTLWQIEKDKIQKMDGEDLLQKYEKDCISNGFHPTQGGYRPRLQPLPWALTDRKLCTGVLDIFDRYLKRAEIWSEKECSTLSIVQEMIQENQSGTVSFGLGPVVLVNFFNIAAFLGLLSTTFGLDRATKGWINDKTTYGHTIKNLGCDKPKEKVKLLKHLAHKLGYPGDMKVAEHALCKSMRKQTAYDVFFHGQSLFDIRKGKHGVTMWEQKWKSNAWVEMQIQKPKEKETEDDIFEYSMEENSTFDLDEKEINASFEFDEKDIDDYMETSSY